MSDETEITSAPSEEPSPEVLVEQLEKAAENWETKAETEAQAADGAVGKEMLYRATADAMRHAKETLEEKQTQPDKSE